MNFSVYFGRQDAAAVAEWIIGSLILVFGLRYLDKIVALVLTELYRFFIQSNRMPF